MPSAEEKAENADLNRQATRELQVLLTLQPALTTVDHNDWIWNLKDLGYQYNWPPHILDLSESVQIPQSLTFEEELDVKNIYLLINKTCAGHTVASTLKFVPKGDAREAFRAVNDYFNRPTAGGQEMAATTFFMMTQASTNLNITQFISRVRTAANTLAGMGIPTDDALVVTVILKGLLEQFRPQKLIIQNWEANKLTVDNVRRSLEDFAQSNGLLELTKSGNANSRTKTYNVNSKPNPRGVQNNNGVKTWWGEPWMGGPKDCQQYQREGCPRGHDCNFNHPTGKGKLIAKKPNQQKNWRANLANAGNGSRNQQQGGTQCFCCGKQGHWMAACPMFQSSQNSRNNKINYHQDQPNNDPTNEEQKDAHRKQPDYAFSLSAREFGTPPPSRTLHNTQTPNTTDYAFRLSAREFEKPTNTKKLGVVAVCCSMMATFSKSTTVTYMATFFVLLFALCYTFTAAAATTIATSKVKVRVYNANARGDQVQRPHPQDLEWCSDPGTNRFVTNDPNDFIPGSVRKQATVVAVGSGDAISRMVGDVLVQSIDYGVLIKCTNVLLLPNCANKLMPASPSVRRGCSISFSNYDKVSVTVRTDPPCLMAGSMKDFIIFKAKLSDTQMMAPYPHRQQTTTRSSGSQWERFALDQLILDASSCKPTMRSGTSGLTNYEKCSV